MTSERNGPPTRDGAPEGPAGSSGRLTTPTAIHITAAGLYRRSTALWDCGHRVPMGADACWRCAEVGWRQAEAAATAVQHLDEHGLPALLDRATCAAVWKLGHRDLAAVVYRRTAGVL